MTLSNVLASAPVRAGVRPLSFDIVKLYHDPGPGFDRCTEQRPRFTTIFFWLNSFLQMTLNLFFGKTNGATVSNEGLGVDRGHFFCNTPPILGYF